MEECTHKCPSWLSIFTDVDWVGYSDDKRFTNGFANFLGPNIISGTQRSNEPCQDQVQKLSTRHWQMGLHRLHQSTLKELGIKQDQPPILWCDKVCQYLSSLTNVHWETVKRILRYIKGTLEMALWFRRPTLIRLSIFTDVHCARCSNDKWSNRGFANLKLFEGSYTSPYSHSVDIFSELGHFNPKEVCEFAKIFNMECMRQGLNKANDVCGVGTSNYNIIDVNKHEHC